MIYLTDKHRDPFQIDEEDYEAVSHFFWYIGRYPQTSIRVYSNGIYIKRKIIKLHHFLLGKAPEGMEWDHENRDKLDNRRFNIRAVTSVVNRRNTNPPRTNQSGFKGVHWDDGRNKWVAQFTILGQVHLISRHTSLEDAVQARLAAEEKYWSKS
jgi:hypothetical protein